LPIWLCPIRAPDPQARFVLYPLKSGVLYINFGFWDVITDPQPRPCGYYNRKIERKAEELGGVKSLYSDSYYTPEEFWAIYDGGSYRALKSKYDPEGRLRDLYDKCVGAAKAERAAAR